MVEPGPYPGGHCTIIMLPLALTWNCCPGCTPAGTWIWYVTDATAGCWAYTAADGAADGYPCTLMNAGAFFDRYKLDLDAVRGKHGLNLSLRLHLGVHVNAFGAAHSPDAPCEQVEHARPRAA